MARWVRLCQGWLVLSDLYDIGTYQAGLFDKPSDRTNSRQLMDVIDGINHSGRGKVFFARQGIKKVGQ